MSDRTKSITAFEAKNRLGKLLDRVQAGEEVVITRHGEAVARLVPVSNQSNARFDAALATFARVRDQMRERGKKISKLDIRKWINEGRR